LRDHFLADEADHLRIAKRRESGFELTQGGVDARQLLDGGELRQLGRHLVGFHGIGWILILKLGEKERQERIAIQLGAEDVVVLCRGGTARGGGVVGGCYGRYWHGFLPVLSE